MTFPQVLVFQGGGALAMAYLHSLRLLETEAARNASTISALCKEFRGVSAGAMAAVFVSLGLSTYKIEQLCRRLFDLVCGDVIFDLETFLTQRGGKSVMIINDIINNAIVDVHGKEFADTTFKELHDKTGITLRIYAAELNCKDPGTRELSHEQTPEMPVCLAVAASCAIPFVFTPVTFRGMSLVDGNAGIDMTLHKLSEHKTLVLSVFANVESKAARLTFQNYIESVVNLLISTMRKTRKRPDCDNENVCIIDIYSDLGTRAIVGGSESVDAIIDAGTGVELSQKLLSFLDK